MNLQFIGVKRKPGWYFYIAWVVINSLYAPLAGWISNYIYDIANHLFDNQTVINGVYIFIGDYTDHYVIYALWGVIMALTQYLLFRPFIQRLGWWIPLTVILWSGTPIFWIATSGLIPISFNGTPVLWRIFFIMPGLILSIFQWLILRKRVYAAHFWLIGSFIGWVFTSISYLIPLSGITPNLEFSILAIATTFVLWIIFRRNPELVEMKVTSPS